MEDLTAFNKYYSGNLKLNTKAHGKVFDKVEKSLSGF